MCQDDDTKRKSRNCATRVEPDYLWLRPYPTDRETHSDATRGRKAPREGGSRNAEPSSRVVGYSVKTQYWTKKVLRAGLSHSQGSS